MPDIGTGNLLQVNPTDGSDTMCSALGPGEGANALTFDSAGNIYVSASFTGTIWKIAPCNQAPAPWVSAPLLQTSGKPPFGANGLAFNTGGTALFVADTGDDSVVKIPVLADAVAGTPEVLAYSVNGADGLIIDSNERHRQSGCVKGLLFPASLVFSGNFVLVTNLALDTRRFGFPTRMSDWAAQVTTFTVSKINAHLPPIPSGSSSPGPPAAAARTRSPRGTVTRARPRRCRSPGAAVAPGFRGQRVAARRAGSTAHFAWPSRRNNPALRAIVAACAISSIRSSCTRRSAIRACTSISATSAGHCSSISAT
ncbi:MAG TPA: hypothetical protein VL742_17140 [Casimicrobiaceae bacterium]|nr:hypothetical protein [Casimicrobiaceae bacterium]